MTERLSMWTVYDHPLDYPDHFVARRFEVGQPTEGDNGVIRTNDTIKSPYLQDVRTVLAEAGLACLPRSDGDEPQIIEVWL